MRKSKVSFFREIIQSLAGNCMFKVSNRTTCEICSKLTIKTPEQHQRHCSGVFIANFQNIFYLVLVAGKYLLDSLVQLITGQKIRVSSFFSAQTCKNSAYS